MGRERVGGRKGGREREIERESSSQRHTIRNVRKIKWSWTRHVNRLKAR